MVGRRAARLPRRRNPGRRPNAATPHARSRGVDAGARGRLLDGWEQPEPLDGPVRLPGGIPGGQPVPLAGDRAGARADRGASTADARRYLGYFDSAYYGLIALALVLIGAVVGVAVAVGLSRFITSLLFGIAATDATTLVGVVGGVMAVGTLACMIPAWRASRVDPLRLIRED